MAPKIPGSRRDRAIKNGKKKTLKPAVRRLNREINFSREKEKGNAWKVRTEVVCIKCRKKFVLPFKPRRPDIYCDECFKKIQKNKKNKF